MCNMICGGNVKLRGQSQSHWGLARPTICQPRPFIRGGRHEKQGKFWSVQSSSGFGSSAPNECLNITFPANTQGVGSVPAFKYKSSKIIDLLPQEAEPRIYSVYDSNGGSGNGLESNQFSFGNPYSGENVRHLRGLSSIRRGKTAARAERVSKRSAEERADYQQNFGSENDLGGNAGSSVWDSNAENIRRTRFRSKYYSPPPQERRASSRKQENGLRNREGDFDSEPRTGSKPFQPWLLPWQWWSTDVDDGDEIDEDDEEDDENDDYNWLSWLNGEFKDAFLFLRWGLPALFLLGTALIPTMLGNPLILLLGFSIFPSVAKYLNPLAKGVLGTIFSPSQNSSKGARQRRWSSSASTRRRQDSARYNGTGSDFASSPSRNYERSDLEVSTVQRKSGTGSLGGWDDMVEDGQRSRPVSKYPLQKRSKSSKKLVLRKQPLYIRIFLALFPFLRGWGGLL